MEIIRRVTRTLTLVSIFSVTCLAQAQHVHGDTSTPKFDANAKAKTEQHQNHIVNSDLRQLVTVPKKMRLHTMANMRDHLLTISQIQDAIAIGKLDQAAALAEQRLGMTSMKMHGAHELSKFMPPGMQDIGASMHHSASQFALEIQNSAATGDLKPAFAALSRMTNACVACHAAYRYQ